MVKVVLLNCVMQRHLSELHGPFSEGA